MDKGRPLKEEVRFKIDRYSAFPLPLLRLKAMARKKSITRPTIVQVMVTQRLFSTAV